MKEWVDSDLPRSREQNVWRQVNQLSLSRLVIRLIEISWIGLSNFSRRVSKCPFPERVCYSFWRNASSLNPLLKQNTNRHTLLIPSELVTKLSLKGRIDRRPVNCLDSRKIRCDIRIFPNSADSLLDKLEKFWNIWNCKTRGSIICVALSLHDCHEKGKSRWKILVWEGDWGRDLCRNDKGRRRRGDTCTQIDS